MTHLKKENINKCFSLLREYIGDTPEDEEHQLAILALDRLRKITAGTQQSTLADISGAGSSCNGKPRAYGSPYE